MGRYSLRDYRMSRGPPKSLKRSICRDLSPEREKDVLVQDPFVRGDRGEERFKSRSRRARCSGNRRAGNAPILRIRGSRSETRPGESGDEDAQRGGVPPIKGENEAPHLAYLSQEGPSWQGGRRDP